MTTNAWALSAYPVSVDYRQRVERTLGAPVQIAVLSQLRTAGALALLRRLRSVSEPVGLVLMEDSAAVAVVPLLRAVASLTPCQMLLTATPDAELIPFRRLTGVMDVARLAWGSIAGLAALVRCAGELAWLGTRAPPKATFAELRRTAYLKTNLWFGLKAGGSVGHVAGVANALARRGGLVDLLAVDRPPLLDPDIRYHDVGHVGVFGYPYELSYYRYQRVFQRRAAAIFAGHKPDFVYHRTSLANYSGVRLARDLGVPLVSEYNGSEVWVAQHWGRPLHFPRVAAKAEELSLRHADLIVTVSDVLGDELLARGIPEERILVHPNCIDPTMFDPARFSTADRATLLAENDIPASATVCGFIGTFGAWHGVTVLAEAIRDLVERDLRWLVDHHVHFLLVGDGLLMPRVREILGGAVARFARLTGLIPQDAAPRYLAACDVLLSPHVPNADGSPFFGSPTKLFEYMAMGKGIVASDLDQIGKVLRSSYRADALPTMTCSEADPHLAVLTTPGSRVELIDAIKFLVERADYRRILGRNARDEAMARYTWERNVDKLLERLQAIMRPTSTVTRHEIRRSGDD